MTKLMQQLQQWANEGRYDWEKGTFNGFHMEELKRPRVVMDHINYLHFDWDELRQLVLDGTIKVWRPVEHYAPPKRQTIHVIIKADKFRLQYQGVISDDGEFYGALWDNMPSSIKLITHWRPLPSIEGVV